MSQANDELVARAQDPNAPLETLHQLAQNYPSLRPHIAANPRTYPALLKWLGTLGDPDVDAALASRGASPAMSASSAVSAASAASTATMAPSLSAASATSAAAAGTTGSAGPVGTAGTARSATSAAVAGSAGAAATAASPASHQPGPSYTSPVGNLPGTPSAQAAGGASGPVSSPVSGPASPYSAGGASPASPDPRFGATQAIPTQPAGYQPRPPSLPAYQAASVAAGQQAASPRSPLPASSPAGAPGRAAAGGGAAAAAGEATVFGVGTDVGSEEKSGGAPSGLFLWILGTLVLALVVFAMTWYLTSNDNDPTSGVQGAQPTRTAAEPGQDATGQASATASATPTPSATPTKEPKAPAPEDAVELGSFTSPSGNITCVLGKTSVSCTINEYNFAGTDASCQGNQNTPFTASVGEEGPATGSCAEVFNSTGATLNYGAAAKNETFACTSSDSGISCWNQYTGQGFTLSRDISQTTER